MKKGTPVRSRRLQAALIAVLAGMFCHAAPATEVHKWTDENGVIHFSDTKPLNTETRTVEINDAQQTSYSQPPPAAPQQPTADSADQPLSAAEQKRKNMAEKRQLQREEQAKAEELCKRHQKRLEQMEPARRVYYQDENGQEVRMDDVQRVTLVEESRNYLAENCN